jgi:hypothetical protein
MIGNPYLCCVLNFSPSAMQKPPTLSLRCRHC